MRKFVGTQRKYYNRALAFIKPRLTNTIEEGVNRIIKIVKNRVSGFRALDAFTDIIFLVVGNLDIPGYVPAKLRTL
jgi:transposase